MTALPGPSADVERPLPLGDFRCGMACNCGRDYLEVPLDHAQVCPAARRSLDEEILDE